MVGGLFTKEAFIGLFGINAAMDMMSFSVKNFLAHLPPEQKFWMFWIGTLIVSTAIMYGTYKFMENKKSKEPTKIKWSYVFGGVFIGLVLIALASPLLPYVFPISPGELAFSSDTALEAGSGIGDVGWLITPIFVAGLLYGLLWMERKKK